ncbi:hypothetical protein GA840_08715 [Pediococcus ethanolidurans]|uniref:type II toxin-antitoxin system RelB/DinJ family antitoxin n=1 Tax=Pediococcus ethanolidurans TaxID=319653 RepID=UPI002955C58D|nr:hypothetical protein [Pediococcus ethanolidurans]MDV7719926.1 hypothetical protein [Pediococcus ethanolidurans]
MAINEKKRIQVKIDRDLDQNVSLIFDQLGLNSTVVITALYKRIVAEGRVPFEFELTKAEKDSINLTKAVYNYNAPTITGKKKVADYLLGEDDADEY